MVLYTNVELYNYENNSIEGCLNYYLNVCRVLQLCELFCVL